MGVEPATSVSVVEDCGPRQTPQCRHLTCTLASWSDTIERAIHYIPVVAQKPSAIRQAASVFFHEFIRNSAVVVYRRMLRSNSSYRLNHALVVKLYHPYRLNFPVTFAYLINES